MFATPAAAEWQLLLEALEQPHRTTRVRRAALTCFVGQDAAGLDAAGDEFADDLALKLRIWGGGARPSAGWRRCSRRCRWT